MKKKEKKPSRIFYYSDYRHFLLDKFKQKRRTDPSFSYRNILKKASLKSTNYLTLVLQRKRNLSSQSIRKLAQALELSSSETRFFKAMVWFNQAESISEKEQYFHQMLNLNPLGRARKIDEKKYAYYTKWFVPVIREMVNLPEFKPSTRWIGQKLAPSVPTKQVAEAVKLLVALGLLEKNSKKGWKQTTPIVSTGPWLESFLVAKFHQAMIQLGLESLDRFPNKDREASSITANMSRKCFEAIRCKIIDFQSELLDMIQKDKNSDEIFQINFQMFPLIKAKPKGKKRGPKPKTRTKG